MKKEMKTTDSDPVTNERQEEIKELVRESESTLQLMRDAVRQVEQTSADDLLAAWRVVVRDYAEQYCYMLDRLDTLLTIEARQKHRDRKRRS